MQFLILRLKYPDIRKFGKYKDLVSCYCYYKAVKKKNSRKHKKRFEEADLKVLFFIESLAKCEKKGIGILRKWSKVVYNVVNKKKI